ncbi:MAG: BamA/TamA family outer membrane protein [Lewinellaceae bacterium]|nr:BamA/TamA family outer membrane protein [Lewinellaceae bacterium]
MLPVSLDLYARLLRNYILLSLLLILSCQIQAQSALKLLIQEKDQSIFWSKINAEKNKIVDNQKDTATFIISKNQTLDSLCRIVLKTFREQSYLAASIDGLTFLPDSSALGTFWLGPSMRLVHLKPANPIVESLLNATRTRLHRYQDAPLDYQEILQLERRLLVQAENNGYPFAQVFLDSIEVLEEGKVSAQLQVNLNRFFSFKELKIIGDVRLPKYYLPNYLGLHQGMPYSRSRVLKLKNQLQSLLFLETSSNPTVTFSGSEATVNLFLKKKKASRFDFIIGILPQPNNTDGRLLLTGSISAAFQNALSLGERFSIDLERLKPETQKLDVSAAVPYLLGTPFGVDGQLGIYKRDSTWVDAQSDIGIQYLFIGGDYLRILWENKSASLQKIDTAQVLASHRLPENLDYKQNSFGAETSFTRLDYRFNPRKGWSLLLKSTAGVNRVIRNNQIESLNDGNDPTFRFSSLYDSISQRATRIKVESRAALYLPIFQRSTIKIGMRGAGIFSNKDVYANEQFRLGGNKLLRGFNEESLQATRYLMSSFEWRLLIGKNSFLAAFADWAYLENFTNRNHFIQRPFGMGAGMNFETPAGIFGISLAVGRSNPGEALDFRAPKFHLGYVSLF